MRPCSSWTSRTRQRRRSCDASSRSTSRPGSRSGRRRSSSGAALAVSPVDGADRARRARAARAADASAHLGGPRADRGRLPPLRRRAARASGDAARRVPARAARRARAEIEEALQATTEMLSQVTRLLALVSAPAFEAATVRHVEVLLLQPNVVMVVVITSTGSVTEAALRVSRAGRPRARHMGGRLPQRARRGRPHRLARRSSARSTSRALRPRERGFLLAIRGAFEQAADGGPAALRRRRGRAARRAARGGDRRVPEPDGGAREAGGAARRARAARSTRGGRSPASATSSSSRRPARARARRRDVRRSRIRRSAPSACSARCAWTTRRRSARCARLPHELSRFVEEVYSDDR